METKVNFNLLVLIVCVFYGCDFYYGFGIINESGQNICYYSAVRRTNYEITYPDTSLPRTPEFVSGLIRPKEKLLHEDNNGTWDRAFKRWVPNDTISVYIFNADTLKKYSWDIVKKNYMILQRYDLSLDDIHALGECIYFPPNLKMRHVKMFPPYGTYNANGSINENNTFE